MHDVIIIGGGPAGLSAALLLARCRRRVLLFDSRRPRNAAARALHGFITRDGTPPRELRALAWADVARYPGVTRRELEVVDATREAEGFRVLASDGSSARSRLLLLATGRLDPLPAPPGFAEFYGRGVHHCPYCDGWEQRDGALAVFGGGADALALAKELFTWSGRVTLCTHGAPPPHDAPAALAVRTEPVSRLEGGTDGALRRVCFADGAPALPCDAIFFATGCPQRSLLPARLGCEIAEDDSVHCRKHAATSVPGLFVAGNVRAGVHLAITAAAEGAEAAIAMNEALLRLGPRPDAS